MTESKPSKHSHKHHTPPTTPPPPEKRARRDSSDSSKEAHVAKAGDTPPSALIAQQHLDRKNGTLEHGHVYFLYRPKVEVDEPHSLDDVQRFSILLVPSTPKGCWRLLTIGRKHLPEHNTAIPGRPQTIWGLVTAVGDALASLKDVLGPKIYETKTRGSREVGPARVAGAGAYLLHSTDSAPKNSRNMSAKYKTYLAYALTLPHELGEVQEEFNIHEEGAFQLQIKSPDAPSTNPRVRDQPAENKPEYPETLSDYFTTKFIPANPPALLNYAGAELLFVPGKHAVEEEIGKEAESEVVKEAEELLLETYDLKNEDEDAAEAGAGHDEAVAVLKELGLDGVLTGRALEGFWE